MSSRIEYELLDMDPCTHEYLVQMRVAPHEGDALCFTLPAWIPGSYMIRDFARNIVEIAAQDDQGEVLLEKTDKQTWSCNPVSGSLRIIYRVYAFDLSVRSAYLDNTRAYFNGTCLFLQPLGFEQADWTLKIRRPANPEMAEWRVATTLPAKEVDGRGYGIYQGEKYASLIDFPVEIGRHDIADFEVDSLSHQLVITDGGDYDIDRITKDLVDICSEHAGMFGVLPVERYLFLTLATAEGYGGLEHLDSTSLICKRSDLPRAGLGRPDKGYRQFLGLCSHEYFHLWNVKRIRPARLVAADLGEEVYTELLWAFEGFTSYYDDLGLARSGVIEAGDYLQLLAEVVTRVMRAPGRKLQSVAASSFDAWTKFYKQDENAPNAIVSYYAKGALVAFGLDVTLRLESDGCVCLDDLMRRLWEVSGATGIGLEERQVQQEAERVLGRPLDDFFGRYVYGTDDLPLTEWFSMMGVGYRLRPARDAKDAGGVVHSRADSDPGFSIGATFEAGPSGLTVRQVIRDSAAQQAGICPGDLVIAIDGEQLKGDGLCELLRRAQGDVEMHYFRRGRLGSTRVQLVAAPDDTCELWWLDGDDLPEAARVRREAWLRSNRRGVEAQS